VAPNKTIKMQPIYKEHKVIMESKSNNKFVGGNSQLQGKIF
jgi:hypothetical protein